MPTSSVWHQFHTFVNYSKDCNNSIELKDYIPVWLTLTP